MRIITAISLATLMLVSPTLAREWHGGYHGGYHGYHQGGSGWVAPAIIGGAILGGALGAAPYYYQQPYPYPYYGYGGWQWVCDQWGSCRWVWR
jgi:hypothetical protein